MVLTRCAQLLLLVGACAVESGCATSERSAPSATQSSVAARRDGILPINASLLATEPAGPENRLSVSASGADAMMLNGAAAYRAGNFGAAAALWDEAAAAYQSGGRVGGRCDALLDLSQAYQSLGSFGEAASALNTALPLARSLHDTSREASALDALGVVHTFTDSPEPAEKSFDAALRLAEADRDDRAVRRIVANHANLLATQGDYAAASPLYAIVAAHARQANDAASEARALTNAALALSRGTAPADALPVVRHAREVAFSLPECRDKADLLLTQGRIFWSEHLLDAKLAAVVDDANAGYRAAATSAGAVGDPALLSFAIGYQGEAAEAAGDRAQALSLTRRALFLAQQAQAPEALYRWQWQIGRLLRAQNDLPGAVEQYSDAVRTLAKIHGDLANSYGNQAGGSSFRDDVGPIYYELADLLLRQADAATDPAVVQKLLLEARDTVELLKSGELDDYFHQKCVNILGRKIEQQARGGAAVVYLIPLADRTEMLVSTEAGMQRFKAPVGSAELTAEVREFRERLEDRSSNRYLINSRRLYNWIIRPIEPTLRRQNVDTLIFVPDGALRTIPMAALNDGKTFLIAHYAVAITPGLTLMVSPGKDTADAPPPNALAGGLSVSQVKGFAPLQFVPEEIGDVHRLFPAGSQLLNQSFTAGNFQSQMAAEDYSFVHLASHAEFSHDQANTFLLTYDRKMNLDDLSRLIERHRYAGKPLELLALSACQTAAGDDRAALGLAGVAIRMGARTAVATLWSVNDQASATLVDNFYSTLRRAPHISKAKAMQQAQEALLADPRYRHPCYWAPYLVIGNWN